MGSYIEVQLNGVAKVVAIDDVLSRGGCSAPALRSDGRTSDESAGRAGGAGGAWPRRR